MSEQKNPQVDMYIKAISEQAARERGDLVEAKETVSKGDDHEVHVKVRANDYHYSGHVNGKKFSGSVPTGHVYETPSSSEWKNLVKKHISIKGASDAEHSKIHSIIHKDLVNDYKDS